MDHRFNQNQLKTTYINESGLYSFILSSKLPSAKKFKHWVTHDVLPKIREVWDQKYKELEQKHRELKQKQIESDQKHREDMIGITTLKKNNNDISKYLRNMEPVKRTQVFYLVTSTEYA